MSMLAALDGTEEQFQRELIRHFIEGMVSRVVDNPEDVRIECATWEDGSIRFLVTTAPTDRGQAIGKEGRIACAIRTLAKAAGAKNGLRLTVEVNGQGERHEPR